MGTHRSAGKTCSISEQAGTTEQALSPLSIQVRTTRHANNVPRELFLDELTHLSHKVTDSVHHFPQPRYRGAAERLPPLDSVVVLEHQVEGRHLEAMRRRFERAQNKHYCTSEGGERHKKQSTSLLK